MAALASEINAPPTKKEASMTCGCGSKLRSAKWIVAKHLSGRRVYQDLRNTSGLPMIRSTQGITFHKPTSKD